MHVDVMHQYFLYSEHGNFTSANQSANEAMYLFNWTISTIKIIFPYLLYVERLQIKFKTQLGSFS